MQFLHQHALVAEGTGKCQNVHYYALKYFLLRINQLNSNQFA